MNDLKAVLSQVETRFPHTVRRLAELVRIPSCRFPGFDPVHTERSAQMVADWLRQIGMPEVRIYAPNGMGPCVVGQDLRAGPQAPTVLLYAHHDVQPPMRAAVWESPAFEPTQRGERLYGRGAADDKGGLALHAAALEGWYAACGQLPVNVIVLCEGEEEVGSPQLTALIEGELSHLRAEVIVVADLVNYAVGLPSITTSLRGLVAWHLSMQALERPVHSGLWGGPLPDVGGALCQVLAGIATAQGQLKAEGALRDLCHNVPPVSSALLSQWSSLPFSSEQFRKEAGIANQAWQGEASEVFTQLWRQPAFAVNALHVGSAPGEAGNILCDQAWARFGLRVPPGVDALQAAAAMEARVREVMPVGITYQLERESVGQAWQTNTAHPYFAACQAALAEGYGVEPVEMGCGATIPFVKALSERFGGVPCLLLAVEDPQTQAHAENESIHLGDLHKAIRSEAILLARLAALGIAPAGAAL